MKRFKGRGFGIFDYSKLLTLYVCHFSAVWYLNLYASAGANETRTRNFYYSNKRNARLPHTTYTFPRRACKCNSRTRGTD